MLSNKNEMMKKKKQVKVNLRKKLKFENFLKSLINLIINYKIKMILSMRDKIYISLIFD